MIRLRLRRGQQRKAETGATRAVAPDTDTSHAVPGLRRDAAERVAALIPGLEGSS